MIEGGKYHFGRGCSELKIRRILKTKLTS